jgi:hypothetical protein
MANTRFNEYIGRAIPLSLSRAMKTYNVSPSDFSDLEEVYGQDDAAIEAAIKQYSPNGQFSVFEFWNRRPL